MAATMTCMPARFRSPLARSPLVIAAATLLACLIAGCARAQTFTGRVVAVHDGDTISVRAGSRTERIRLVDIDCPEYRQPYSTRAKRFTSEMVFGKEVRVDGRGRDKYDRILARVLVDGTDLNEAIVRNGYGWHYEIGRSDPRLEAAERAAAVAKCTASSAS